MSRSRRKRQRSNRSAQILASIFSIVIVLSVILSMVGSFTLRSSRQSAPTPTLFPTFTPFDLTPSPTPTADVPPAAITATPAP